MTKPLPKPILSGAELRISQAFTAYQFETGWRGGGEIPLPLLGRLHRIHHESLYSMGADYDFSLATTCECCACAKLKAWKGARPAGRARKP
jgi:hypothetical protein